MQCDYVHLFLLKKETETVMKIIMISKKNVIQGLEKLPDHLSIDDLLDRLLLIEKIETGLKQSEQDETVSTEDARKRLEKWLR